MNENILRNRQTCQGCSSHFNFIFFHGEVSIMCFSLTTYEYQRNHLEKKKGEKVLEGNTIDDYTT